MEIKQKKKITKKSLIVTAFAIAVLVVAAGVFYVHHQSQAASVSSSPRPVNSVDYGNATTDQISAGNATKDQTVSGNGTDAVPSPSVSPNSSKKVAQITLTAKNQTTETYQIRAQINGLLTKGTCSLTLTQGSRTVTKTASVQNLSNTSTCMGFDVPLSELGSGTWQLTLTADSDTITGTANSSISVQ